MIEDERKQIDHIMKICTPLFGNLINQVMDPASQGNQDALGILYLICKVFYIANNVAIVECLKTMEGLLPWVQLFAKIIEMKVPDDLGSFTEDMDVIESRDK